MNIIGYFPFILLLLSCDSNTSQKEPIKNLGQENITEYKQYVFFHNKLKISSPIKPYEEDATNTVSKLALTLYSDIKKYSLMNVFETGGMIGVTVSEFKESDSSFSEKKYFDELLKVYENNEKFTVEFDNKSAFKQYNFEGFKTKAQLFIAGKKSSMMDIQLMSDKKIIIISVSIYDKNDDLKTIDRITGSIKKNRDVSE